MTETVRTLIEASKTIEGEHKAYIGAYISEKDGMHLVNAGGDAELTFLLANVIVQTAVGMGVRPKAYMHMVWSAFRYVIRHLKGREIATIHTIDGRDLEKN